MTPSGIESATCRFVAQCLNHYATAPHQNFSIQANSMNLHNNLRTKVMKCCTNIYLNRQKVIPNYVVLWLNKLLYEYLITQRDGSYQNVNFSDRNRDRKLNDGREKFYVTIWDSLCRPCILIHKVCMLRAYAGLGYAQSLTHGVNRPTATLGVWHMTSIVRRPLLASDTWCQSSDGHSRRLTHDVNRQTATLTVWQTHGVNR
jgi:hypothetical protein